MIIICDSPDVLVLPLWTLLLKEVVHHDAAHAVTDLKAKDMFDLIPLTITNLATFSILALNYIKRLIPVQLFSLPFCSFPQPTI